MRLLYALLKIYEYTKCMQDKSKISIAWLSCFNDNLWKCILWLNKYFPEINNIKIISSLHPCICIFWFFLFADCFLLNIVIKIQIYLWEIYCCLCRWRAVWFGAFTKSSARRCKFHFSMTHHVEIICLLNCFSKNMISITYFFLFDLIEIMKNQVKVNTVGSKECKIPKSCLHKRSMQHSRGYPGVPYGEVFSEIPWALLEKTDSPI